MTFPLQFPCPGPSDRECVFWHDFEELTSGNLWLDKSRNGLHATPQAGFAAPNYGLARTARGKGYANFTGAANSYATLPLRFYDVAPTGTFTFVYALGNLTDKNHRVFSTWNESAGNYRGILHTLAQAGRASYLYQFQGGGTLPVNTANSAWSTSDGIVGIHTCETAGRVWRNGTAMTAVWTTGAFGTGLQDTAAVPCIGKLVVTNDYLVGRGYFLALFRDWVPTDGEAKALTQWLRDGGGA